MCVIHWTTVAFVTAMVGSLLSSPAFAEETCTSVTAGVTVDGARRVLSKEEVEAAAPKDGDTKQPPPRADNQIELGDVLAVKLSDVSKLSDKACEGRKIVLFLDGRPIKGLTPFPPTDPSQNELLFVLRTNTAPDSWNHVLGQPTLAHRFVTVSVGFENLFPLRGTGGTLPRMELDVVPTCWLVIWLILFLIMMGGFLYCAWRSNIIRDGNPTGGTWASRGTYSLAKTQGAWWFFIILAAYLLIGIVTGDFVQSLNSTALILLGIGAGTVLGSAAIDASKSGDEDERRTQALAIEARLAAIKQRQAAITDALALGQPETRQALLDEQAALTTEEATKKSQYQKLVRSSENILIDILSDASGISFHRFQMAAWTLVLSVIFVKGVYETLAMPVFDTTLMGLLGLSAGTYLGLKIPEATTVKK